MMLGQSLESVLLLCSTLVSVRTSGWEIYHCVNRFATKNRMLGKLPHKALRVHSIPRDCRPYTTKEIWNYSRVRNVCAEAV
jgi:hypothetical protein